MAKTKDIRKPRPKPTPKPAAVAAISDQNRPRKGPTTGTELAALLGISHPRLTALMGKDGWRWGRRGPWTIAQVAQIEEWREERKAEADGTDIKAARLRKENALADRYEIMVEEARGRLIEADAVKREWANIGNVIRSGFQSLAPQLVPIALRSGMPSAGAVQFQREAQEHIDAILANLSRHRDADDADDE